MSGRRLIAAVGQMTSTADIGQNFLQASGLVQTAVSKFNAQLVCLPECFAFIGENFKQSLTMAEDLDGNIIKSYRSLAKEHKVWLSLGGFQKRVPPPPEVSETQLLRNTHLILSPEGEIVSEYAKMHLFDVDIPNGPTLRESAFTQPGEEVVVSETPIGNLGLSIVCFNALLNAHNVV
jgi:predicted amidohydrolase